MIKIKKRDKIVKALLDDDVDSNLRGFIYMIDAVSIYRIGKMNVKEMCQKISERYGVTSKSVYKALYCVAKKKGVSILNYVLSIQTKIKDEK